MTAGTKLRTILRIATSLQTALYVTTAAIADFHSTTLMLLWGIFTIVCDFVIAFVTTYYNNDYTEHACLGTGYTRWLKAVEKGETFGEGLQDEPETDAEEDELEGDFFE